MATAPDAGFREWYRFFPWEDWRAAAARRCIDAAIMPGLRAWVARGGERGPRRGLLAASSACACCSARTAPVSTRRTCSTAMNCSMRRGWWRRALRDGREPAPGVERASAARPSRCRHDHRRILATAMGRLRAKMKYRPVIFELMPENFTLTALQTHGRGDLRPPSAQAEFPPPGRGLRRGRADRRNVARHRRAAGGFVPLPPRGAAGASGAGPEGGHKGLNLSSAAARSILERSEQDGRR